MFDIGFTELLLCLVVALVVIGPEQLPGTVRTVALWIGRLKRSLVETRSEIERQIGADEIRRQLHNEEIMRNIEETRRQLEASLREHGVLDESEDGNKDAAQHTPSAADYGPPDELPDHAHQGAEGRQLPNPPEQAQGAARAPQQSSAASPAASSTPHNNQQGPTPVAEVKKPTEAS